MMTLTRRQWLKSAGIVVGACATEALWLEPCGLRVSHHNVPAQGATGRRIRLIQISDLHLRTIDGHAEQIAKAINASSADVAIITGDAVDDGANVGLLNEFLSGVDSSLRKFAILGNWEYWGRVNIASLRYVYARHNCELLVNQATPLELADRRVRLVGLDDLVGGRPDLARGVRYVPRFSDDVSILLEHCPAFRDHAEVIAARDEFAVLLAGHTHGGQIAPLGWAAIRPPGSGRYVRGWYRDRDRVAMYVSRGLGTSVVPARFFSPPELAVFEL